MFAWWQATLLACLWSLGVKLFAWDLSTPVLCAAACASGLACRRRVRGEEPVVPHGHEGAAAVRAYVCGLLAVGANEKMQYTATIVIMMANGLQLPVAILHAKVVILTTPIGMLMTISVLQNGHSSHSLMLTFCMASSLPGMVSAGRSPVRLSASTLRNLIRRPPGWQGRIFPITKKTPTRVNPVDGQASQGAP